MKIVVIWSVAQLVTTVIFFLAWDKSRVTRVTRDNSWNSTQKMKAYISRVQCITQSDCFARGCLINFWTRLNIKIGLVQKVYEWPGWYFAKMILQSGDHFGQGTAWSLIHFLNYASFDIQPSLLTYETPSISWTKLRSTVLQSQHIFFCLKI